MIRPTLKRRAKKRKPAGYEKDIRTATILNMFGGVGLPNIAPNYLEQCSPTTQRGAVRRIRSLSKRNEV